MIPSPTEDELLAEAAAVLKDEYGLSGFALEKTAKGHSNLNFIVSLTGARRFVLRSPRSGHERFFASEIRLMEWLNRMPLWNRTPHIIMPGRTDAGFINRNGRFYAVMSYISGTSAKPCSPEIRPHLRDLQAIGQAVGELHSLLGQAPADFSWPTSHYHEISALCRDVQRLFAEAEHEPSEKLRAILLELRPCLVRILNGNWNRWMTRAASEIIHGDIRFANVLMDPLGKVVAVLDYESVGPGPSIYAHAHAARNLISEETQLAGEFGHIWEDGLTAYLQGYEQGRGSRLQSWEREAIRAFVPVAALHELRFLLVNAQSFLPLERRYYLLRLVAAQLSQ